MQLRAGGGRHEALDLLAHPGGFGLLPAALEIGDHALEGFCRLVGAQAVVIGEGDLLRAGAVQDGVLRLLAEVAETVAELEAVHLAERFQRLRVVGRGRLGPWADGAVAQRDVLVGHDEAGVDGALAAEPVAGRAGAERIVEGEQPGLDLGNGEARYGAGEFLREKNAFVGFVRGLVDRVQRRSGWRRAGGRRIPPPRCRRRASAPSRSSSASRVARSARTTMRSTTTSMSCLYFLSSAGTSAIS